MKIMNVRESLWDEQGVPSKLKSTLVTPPPICFNGYYDFNDLSEMCFNF